MIFELPKQLQKPEFRFIFLKESEELDNDGRAIGKSALEFDWQNTKNYSFEEIIPKMQTTKGASKKRCGIIGGFGNLCIVDIDKKSKNFEKGIAAMEKLPFTFKVETISGGRHYYFICKDMPTTKLKNDLGEIRGKGAYVVCAGSELRGEKYAVINP